MNVLIRRGVFAGGNFQSLWRRSEIQVVGFDAAGVGIVAGIGVYRDEKVGLLLIGDGSASLQRDESIVAPSEGDFSAQPRLQQLTQALAYVEHQVFFQQAI